MARTLDHRKSIGQNWTAGPPPAGAPAPPPEGVGIADLGSRCATFDDTAGVMVNLDLVITSDTSVAHLAGALGRPVWVALKRSPDWCGLLERADSPWYPTMRLFRQRRSGEWD